MVEQSGTARRPAATDPPRPDALANWYLQEITPLDGEGPGHAPPEPVEDDVRMPAGWWLVPAVLLSIPVWVVLGAALL